MHTHNVSAYNNIADSIDLSLLQKMLVDAKKIGCKNFFISGGDPTNYKKLIELVRICQTLEYSVMLSTRNEISLCQLMNLYDAGLEKIQISLDSYNEILVDEITGIKGSFKKTLATIERAKKVGLYVRVKAVVFSENANDIEMTIDFFNSLKVDEINLTHYSASGGKHSIDYYPSENQLRSVDEIILKKQKKQSNIIYDFGRADYYRYSQKTFHMIRKSCAGCRDTLIVDYDGKVYFCEYMMHDQRFVVGDLKTESLSEIWTSDNMKKWFVADNRQFIGTRCYDCSLFVSCYAKRCFARTVISTGTPYNIDPWCIYGSEAKKYL